MDKIQVKRVTIPTAIRRRIYAMNCAVCGVPYGIQADHIKPVACGGSNEAANIQPLCRDCNYLKHCNKTNEQVRSLIIAKGLPHFRRSVYKNSVRFMNVYARPTIDEWKLQRPELEDEAKNLYIKFLESLL